MESANMTFREETLRLRVEGKQLRQRNAILKRKNEKLEFKILSLEKDNLALRRENNLLKEKQLILVVRQEQLEKQIEGLNLIVEELRRMVFGKKKATGSEGSNGSGVDTNSANGDGQTKKRKKAERTADSYRRAVPKEDEVTETIDHPLTHCPDCGTLLLGLKQIIRYTEDIIDLVKLAGVLKKIEKHIIGSGYCPGCKRRKLAIKISPQVSILGENVKQLVCYLSIVMRLSFEQVRCFVSDSAGLNLSDGEITSCLDEQAEKLRPERERLLTKIRGAPGRHYDETGWKVQYEGLGNYCWITRPTAEKEAVFLMGRSRGKGNAKELRGEVDNQVGISDDYAAYDNLFSRHQLCMAHPHRKLRDLSQSKTLSPSSVKTCSKSYLEFKGLYQDLEKTLGTEYEPALWLEKREGYIQRLKKISVITKQDPQKLKAIKQSLSQNAEKYFTCLEQPGIPSDNNPAERGLRHIVLKRKISYGSKTQKGANTMAILCTTLLSAWWNKPENFFVAYRKMLNP